MKVSKEQVPNNADKISDAFGTIIVELGVTLQNYDDALKRLMDLLPEEITKEDLIGYILDGMIPSVLETKGITILKHEVVDFDKFVEMVQ